MNCLVVFILALRMGANAGGVGSANGGNVWSSSGNSINTNCDNNNVCQTCINNRCFKRTYSNVMSYGKCPAAACENLKDCKGLVYSDKDNCPICQCSGFSTREPCTSNSDCLSPSGKCVNVLCRYPAVRDGLPKVCIFARDCPKTDDCINQKCTRDSAGRRHLLNQGCVFDYECPSGYKCDGMTCWEGGSQHTGGFCTFSYECPTKYECQGQTCVFTGKEHGTSSCVFDDQCAQGQTCVNMTCQ